MYHKAVYGNYDCILRHCCDIGIDVGVYTERWITDWAMKLGTICSRIGYKTRLRIPMDDQDCKLDSDIEQQCWTSNLKRTTKIGALGWTLRVDGS